MKGTPFLATVFVMAASASVVRAQHNTDLWIGVSGGKVALSPGGLMPGSVYLPLGRVDTFLHGWSSNNPGFDRAALSQGGVAPLPGSARIRLKVEDLDPALYVIDNAFNVLDSPGDVTVLGTGTDLHVHLTWFVDDTDPGFDAARCVWVGTFKLEDTGGGLGASTPFTLFFSNVPVRGGEFPPMPSSATGDFDVNQRVDLGDAKAFAVCINGPDWRPQPDDPLVATCEVDCHNAFDFDDDLDIDLLDFAEFQVNYNP